MQTLSRNVEFKSNKYRDIFAYYSELADFAGTISIDEEPLHFLSQNFKRTALANNSVLSDFLKGECKQINGEGLVLLPFDFNQSQSYAIDTALKTGYPLLKVLPALERLKRFLI